MDAQLWQDRFAQHLQARNYSERTIEAYCSDLRCFLRFLGDQNVDSISSLTQGLLEEFRLWLFYLRPKGKPLSVATQAGRLGAVRQFVRFLVRQDYLMMDVSANLDLPRRPQTLPRTLLSERETVQLLESPPTDNPLGIRDRTVLEVLYATGLRNSELATLQLEELDWEHHCIRLRRGKGGKSRVVPLGEEAEIWLAEYLERARPAFLRSATQHTLLLNTRGKALTRETLSEVVTRWARKAGLQKAVTPHVLRHCCATHMLKRGAELRYLQAMLGHASVNTTERYTQIEVSDLRKVVLRCHPRECRR